MEEELYKEFDNQLYRIGGLSPMLVSVPKNMAVSGISDLGSGSYSGNMEIDGGYIQSSNFKSGSDGWKLDSNGDFEGNDGTFRGTITATAGTIGGWTIGSTTLTGGGVTLDSAGIITGGIVRTSSGTTRVELKSTGNALNVYSSGVLMTQLAQGILSFNTSAGLGSGDIYGVGTNQIAIDVGDAGLIVTETYIEPFTDEGSSLGVSNGRWNNLYMTGSIFIYETGIPTSYIEIVAPSLSASWTLTLPTTDGTSGQFLTTDGLGVLSWSTSSSGATTALDNLASVAINTSLVSDTASTDNLGSSLIPWNILYVDDVYMTNGAGDIRYNGNIAISLFASDVRLGAGYDLLGPASALSANLGSSTYRWSFLYVDEIDATGNISTTADMYCDGLRLLAGTAHNPATEGEITFYDSGSIQYRGQIVSTDYSFDLTVA